MKQQFIPVVDSITNRLTVEPGGGRLAWLLITAGTLMFVISMAFQLEWL